MPSRTLSDRPHAIAAARNDVPTLPSYNKGDPSDLRSGGARSTGAVRTGYLHGCELAILEVVGLRRC